MIKSTLFFVLVAIFFTACSNEPTADKPTATTENTTTNSTVDASATEPKAPLPSFEEVDPSRFNAQLAAEKKTLSPKEVIQLYYPAVVPKEDNSYQKIDIETRTEGSQTIVTLTHDNQPHIVIQGHRIIMTLEQKDKQWTVISMKQQFKCWVRDKKAVAWSADRCS